MKIIKLSSNRVASFLNTALATEKYSKGTGVHFSVLIKLIVSSDTPTESKKAFLCEFVDVADRNDLRYLLVEQDIDEFKSLIYEINDEMLSGEWKTKEKEFEENYQKIRRRKDIIGGIDNDS
jgi:hypothetical protein